MMHDDHETLTTAEDAALQLLHTSAGLYEAIRARLQRGASPEEIARSLADPALIGLTHIAVARLALPWLAKQYAQED